MRKKPHVFATLALAVIGNVSAGAACPPSEYPVGSVQLELIRRGGGNELAIQLSGSGNGSRITHSRTGERTEKQFFVLSPELLELLNRFYAADFFNLRDAYGDEVVAVLKDGAMVQTQTLHESGGGSVTITVHLGDCVKTTRLGRGAPPEAMALAVDFERYAEKWAAR